MEQTVPGAAPTVRKALEAWNLCLNANVQTFQQLTNWWTNTVKENVSLYAELQASSLEALQAGNAYASRRFGTLSEEVRDPMGSYQRTVGEFADHSARVARLLQNNVQAMWRSGEQCWLNTQQTNSVIQEHYTRLSQSLTALYTAD